MLSSRLAGLLLLALAWPSALLARAPETAVQLDRATLPADEVAATLLHIATPGRFALAAHSASGASLQLVDQLAGPGEVAGIPGVQDGRVDALLDGGTYKLRVGSAPHAQGSVGLTAIQFRDAAPLQTLASDGQPVSGSLGDVQQRRFWLVVPDGHVRIVASGRALADLRLWRDGRDLVDAQAQPQQTEPVHGHPMTELALTADIEPGTYMVTAYGGPKLTWADGDASTPFFLRAGARAELAGVWASGTVGPSGLEIFAVPDWAASIRLDLPKSAPVTLALGDAQAVLETRSREPWIVLSLPPLHHDANRADLTRLVGVQLRGAAGQPYRLTVSGQIGPRYFSTPGTWFVSAATQGMGGDEVPPGLLLQRQEYGLKSRILADTVPHVGPGAAWRARFNLRGPTTLLVQADGGGKLSLRTDGVELDRKVDPQSYYDIAADLLDLSLVPADGAAGALDVMFGPPGLVAGLAKPFPPDPVVPFGEQELAPRQSLVLDGPHAPGASFGLSVRPSPVVLDTEPLLIAQMPGQVLRIPVAHGNPGTLEAHAIGDTTPLAMSLAPGLDRSIASIPAPSAPRQIVLAYRPTPTPEAPPAPRAAAALPRIQAGRAVFLTLADAAPRSFALHVAEGGLYQVETLGRLHTEESLGTPFIPTVATDDGAGPGHNARVNPWLRAGDYRVTVTAHDSAGHAGLLATPAPLLPGPSLLPGGTARATLPAGQGVLIPIEVAHAGRYRLTLLGQAQIFTARLDDEEGWPLTAPGPFAEREQVFQPGHYRLLVTPGPVAARLVAAMEEVLPPRIITGHGPHALGVGETLGATWHEPPSPAAPRTPDTYTFSLAGPAHAHLRLGDGMGGVLSPTKGAPIRVSDRWDGELAAGHWRLDVRSDGRNDRLDYVVSLDTDELQPDRPRPAAVPSTHDFTLAEDRVVTLATQGPAAVRAELRADGIVLARSGARPDDWNTVLSQRLPAGRYTVALLPGAAPDTTKLPGEAAQPLAEAANDQTESGDPSPVQDMATPDTPPPEDAPVENSRVATRTRQATMLSLTLPPNLPSVAAAQARTLAGAGVHLLNVATPPPGSLLVAHVHLVSGAGTAVLALERQDASGGWRQVSQSSGSSPFVAAISDSAPALWRVAAWALDPGMTFSADVRALTDAPSGRADPVPGLGLAAARLTLSNPAISTVQGPPGLLQASWPGHKAVPLDAGRAVPQGDVLWLVGPQAGPVSLTQAPGPWTLDLAPGEHAAFPAPAQKSGVLHVWRADSGDGQPVWTAGQDAVSLHSAVTTGIPLLAAGDAPARVEVSEFDVAPPKPHAMAGALSERLAPHAALRLRVPDMAGDLLLSLAPGMAAFPDDAGGGVWAPLLPVTRRVPAPKTLLIVNLGDRPAIASAAPVPHVGPDTLAPGQVLSAFHGAAGSFDLQADILANTRLALAGEGEMLVRDAAGHVLTGREATPAPGRARVTVSYGPGASILWLDSPGKNPWPRPIPTSVQLPASQALRGPAMAFSIEAKGPMLLHASTTAPVLLGLDRATPELFAAGAEFHRAIPGGVTMRVMPAQDGPLSGTVSLWTETLRPAREGLGEAVLVPPGHSAAFAFILARPSRIGLGVRANPDVAAVRLLDAAGHVVGEGTAQLRDLAAGHYVIEARVPPGAPPTSVRPALLGTVPRPSGPPDDVASGYLDLAGLRSAKP